MLDVAGPYNQKNKVRSGKEDMEAYTSRANELGETHISALQQPNVRSSVL